MTREELLEKRRAGFEKWSGGEGIPYANDRYASSTLDMEWVIWNAALDSVEIELPPEWAPISEKDEGANEMREYCVYAVEMAGLKVKA